MMEQSFKQSGPLSPQPSMEYAWLSHQNEPRPPWQFGRKRVKGWRRWARVGEQPFFLDPSQHQGVVLGLCERGIDMSLLRLATNAARRSWRVILFDALGSESQAATFLAAMYQAGCIRAHSFPNEPYAAWRGTPGQILERLLWLTPFREPYYRHIASACLSALLKSQGVASLDELVRELALLCQQRRADLPPVLQLARSADLAGVPLRYGALATSVGDSLDGRWSFEDTEAAYCSFNAWAHPQQARSLASFLLADLASCLTERLPAPERVLLLIKYPDLLFDLEQVAPLFAQMERLGGSVFIAVRSTADLGGQSSRILSNARTLLLHRSSTSLHFTPYVRWPWWRSTPPFFNVRDLPDDECLAICNGRVTHVRIDPVVVETADVLRAQASIPLPAQKPTAGPIWGEPASDPFAPYRAPFEPFDLSFPDLALPDEVDGMMVMGTPLEERTQEQHAGAPKTRTPRVRGKRTRMNKAGSAKVDRNDVLE